MKMGIIDTIEELAGSRSELTQFVYLKSYLNGIDTKFIARIKETNEYAVIDEINSAVDELARNIARSKELFNTYEPVISELRNKICDLNRYREQIEQTGSAFESDTEKRERTIKQREIAATKKEADLFELKLELEKLQAELSYREKVLYLRETKVDEREKVLYEERKKQLDLRESVLNTKERDLERIAEKLLLPPVDEDFETRTGLYTIDGVCQMLGVSKQYIYRLMSKGEIPFITIGGHKKTYFRKQDLRKCVKIEFHNINDK